jgi:hypothetical protein
MVNLEDAPLVKNQRKLEAAREAVSGLEIRAADINNTASIQEFFSGRSATKETFLDNWLL